MNAKRIHEVIDAATEALTLALEDGYAQLFTMIDDEITSFPAIKTTTEGGIDIPSRTRVQACCELTSIKENKRFILAGLPAHEYADRMTALSGTGFFYEKVTGDGTFVIGPTGIAIPFGAKPPYRSFECNVTAYIKEASVQSTEAAQITGNGLSTASVSTHAAVTKENASGASRRHKSVVRLWDVLPPALGTILCVMATIDAANQHAWLAAVLSVIFGIANVRAMDQMLKG